MQFKTRTLNGYMAVQWYKAGGQGDSGNCDLQYWPLQATAHKTVANMM
jgi:hypothetical protein